MRSGPGRNAHLATEQANRCRIGGEDLIVGGDIGIRIMGISLDRPDCLAAVRAKVAVALTVPAPR